MRKIPRVALLCLVAGIFLAFFLPGCMKDQVTRTYTIIKPVFKAKSSVLSEINGPASTQIGSPGKIYIKDNLIFLNEVDKGIHIIDNSDPSHPVKTAFLAIPGNQDIAVKGNILYADMYNDLLSIDISDPKHVQVKNVLNDLFTERQYVNGFFMDSNQVITGWIAKDTTVPAGEDGYPGVPDCNGCEFFSATSSSAAKSTGVAGSMARMVLIKDYLYAITERHSLGVVNVDNASAPFLASDMFAGYDLQTIYPFADKLFLGSAIGMFMYDIADPAHPSPLGQFSHGRACDPVVADGKYAYVTLHAGTQCGGESNELDVIDIQNLQDPELVKTYSLTRPTGLCKDGNLLFVCDGQDVKIYDASYPSDLKLKTSIKSDEPYDVIAQNNVALVVAKDGLYQYDYRDGDHISLLSFISIK